MREVRCADAPWNASKVDASPSLVEVGYDPLGKASLVLYHKVFRDAIQGVVKPSTPKIIPKIIPKDFENKRYNDASTTRNIEKSLEPFQHSLWDAFLFLAFVWTQISDMCRRTRLCNP